MRIALCCCFRNEETEIAGMLHSCYGVADHVYLLDNASTDRTRQIAEYWCIKAGLPYALLTEPVASGWPDHLYNRLLDLAASEGNTHTLLLDADERLSGYGRQMVKQCAEEDRFDAYAVPRRTIITPYCPTAGGEIQPYTDSYEINEKHYRFFRSGQVRYPEGREGPHWPPAPVEGATKFEPATSPTWITHDRDGWEQLKRDKSRGQYPETRLPELWELQGGWFDYQRLYEVMVNNARDGDTLVELGNYLGRSILYLGKLVQESGKKIKIVGVDLYRAQECCPYMHVEVMETGYRWLHRTAEAIHRAGLADIVSLIQWPSDGAARLFEDGSVGGVWIDADHDYEPLCRDIAAWWPKVRSGGFFGGHDYSTLFPGVMQATHEFSSFLGLPMDISTSPGSWAITKP